MTFQQLEALRIAIPDCANDRDLRELVDVGALEDVVRPELGDVTVAIPYYPLGDRDGCSGNCDHRRPRARKVHIRKYVGCSEANCETVDPRVCEPFLQLIRPAARDPVAAPGHVHFECPRMRGLRIATTDFEESSPPLAAEEMLEEKPVLTVLRKEIHRT